MTGETTSIHGHTTRLTALEARGTGAGIGVRSGAGLLGATAGMTHGSTVGTTHGITEDIGEATGIRIMPAGTAVSVLIGDTTIMDRDMDMEDTSTATDGTDREMRPRWTEEFSPVRRRPLTEEVSAPAAV